MKDHRPSVLRRLQEIYDALPSIDCKRLCGKTHCGPVRPMKIERRNVLLTIGYKFEFPHLGINQITCPHLNNEGDCSIYEARPAICRLWGLTEDLPCPHGCVPERVISTEEAQQIMRTIYDLA